MIREFKEGDLREMILADGYNRLVFGIAGRRPLYIVGGYIRDILIGKINADRDYVAGGDYESLLKEIAGATGGKLIRLGGYLGRIVLKDNSTLDFSPLANDISDDLSLRDFTINALAWSPGSGILDPYGGLRDLRMGNIRIISRSNVERDPVRILRAYRFAAESSFKIDRITREVIKELSHRITETKSERITLEFFKIMNLQNAKKILAMMSNDGILQQLFPLLRDGLRSKLRVFSRVERIFNALPLKCQELLCKKSSQNLSCLGMLRLEALLEGSNSANALTLSSFISRRLRMIEKANKFLSAGKWRAEKMFEAFSLMGDASLDFIVIKGRTSMLSDYERYLGIQKRGLLPIEEIVNVSGLSGSNLGGAIRMLRKAEFTHEIESRQGAVNALRKYASDLT